MTWMHPENGQGRSSLRTSHLVLKKALGFLARKQEGLRARRPKYSFEDLNNCHEGPRSSARWKSQILAGNEKAVSIISLK